jgi:hypothetical protein
MQLIEINGKFNMDTGAPSPFVVTNESRLFVAFYLLGIYGDGEELHMRNTTEDKGVCVMEFKRTLDFRLGRPGDETLSGHPYYKLGLSSYGFYELKDSDLLKKIDGMQKVHPRYNPKFINNFRHYIITFHDTMFECVATDYSIAMYNKSMSAVAMELTSQLYTE